MAKTRSQMKACKQAEKLTLKGKKQTLKGHKTLGKAVVRTTPNVAPYVPPKFKVLRVLGGLDVNEKGDAVLNIVESEILALKLVNPTLYNSMDIIYQCTQRVFYTEFLTNGFEVCKLHVDFDCNTVQLIRIDDIPVDNAFLTIYFKMYLLIENLGFEVRANYDARIARQKAEARRAQQAKQFNGCGCFTPETLVPISDKGHKTYRRIDKLIRGDTLIGPDGKIQIVAHILKTQYVGPMISYNGLFGTPGHPICVDKWIQMKDAPGASETEVYSGFVYTLSAIGEDNTYVTSFMANDEECAALGHGYTDEHCDSITHGALASTFWGKRILQIFESKVGQELVDSNGVMTLDNNYELIRDPATGWVTDLKLDC